jgi:RNA-binding protein 8A
MGDEEFPTLSRTVKIADHAGKSLKKKGRGFDAGGKDEGEARYEGRGGIYDRLGPGPGEAETGPQKSIEGWIICISNLHPEISEDVIQDKFMDFGTIKNIHLNLDRQTGFVKGYALIEYEFLEEARSAVKQMNGKDILGQDATVDFAFSKKPPRRR